MGDTPAGQFAAIFYFEDNMRWKTRFYDRIEEWSRQQPGADALPSEPVDPTRFQLIDHILFTQSLVGKNASPRVKAHAGLILHHCVRRDEIEALPDGFKGFWLSSPANIIHLVASRDDL